MSNDLSLFLRELIRKPHQVVALAPSSVALARAMVEELKPGAGAVLELGAGTGKITEAILDRGIAPQDLHLVEMNPEFCAHLRARFPGVDVRQMSAGEIGNLPLTNVQAVVSGLPLLSMPVSLQRAILTGACTLLGPGGTYTQFTYGPAPPVARAVREELALKWRASGKIWWNLPPARVYRFWSA